MWPLYAQSGRGAGGPGRGGALRGRAEGGLCAQLHCAPHRRDHAGLWRPAAGWRGTGRAGHGWRWRTGGRGDAGAHGRAGECGGIGGGGLEPHQSPAGELGVGLDGLGARHPDGAARLHLHQWYDAGHDAGRDHDGRGRRSAHGDRGHRRRTGAHRGWGWARARAPHRGGADGHAQAEACADGHQHPVEKGMSKGMSTVRAHTELVQGFQAIMATPMGVHVAAAPNEAARAGEAIADCLSWLGEVDRQLTRFSATSDLCQLNADAGQWHDVSQLLFDAVEQSVAAARASDGLFDPTLLTQLEQIGYDRDFAAIERREVAANGQSVPAAPATGSWRDIALDPATQRIRLPLGTRLDLGGIAKGWAADVALERCFAGWAHVLIDAGGDMRARGGPEEGALWALGIGDPRVEVTAQTEPRHAAVLTLGRGGLATSGATTRWWYQGGERRHHLLDPRTG